MSLLRMIGHFFLAVTVGLIWLLYQLSYLVLAVLLVPVAGLAVAASLGDATSPWATLSLWSAGTYGALALITLAVMELFGFRNCCIGLHSLRHHLTHYRRNHVQDLLMAITWPYSWHGCTKALAGWMIRWEGIVFEPLECWIMGMRKGYPVEFVDMKEIHLDYDPMN